MRVSVGAGNGSRSLQINLFEVSASTGKGEKRKPVESVRHINPQRGVRPLRLLECSPTLLLPHSTAILGGLASVSLSGLRGCLPEFDRPVRVLVQ